MFRSVFILVLTVVKLTHSFSDVGKWELPLSGVSNTVHLLIPMLFRIILVYFSRKYSIIGTDNKCIYTIAHIIFLQSKPFNLLPIVRIVQ